MAYTTETIIDKCKSLYGDRYDYSLAEYTHSHAKMKIICREHGVFETATHQFGTGCKSCHYESRRLSIADFVERAEEVHNNRYDYSQSIYKSSNEKIGIICKEHGMFYQYPFDHMNGFGCAKCSNKSPLTTDKFIQLSAEAHNNRYDYSLSNCISSHKKIKIICPVHGIFEQVAYDHMIGHGCFNCNGMKGIYSSSFFENYPEEKSKDALLYLLSIKNNNETMIKIGITIRTIDERYSNKEYSTMEINVLQSAKLPLYEAFMSEQFLLEKYKEERFYTNQEKFGGHTECLKYKEDLIKELSVYFKKFKGDTYDN